MIGFLRNYKKAKKLYAAALKPCPFCAGHMDRQANQLQSYAAPALYCDQPAPGLSMQVWKVKCWSCSASVFGTSAEAAVKVWNRRTP